MGDHSTPRLGVLSRLKASYRYGTLRKLRADGVWLWSHRRKVASLIVIGLPFVSRVLPDFPAADILAFLRVYFGA
jgi:hypothetical protein